MRFEGAPLRARRCLTAGSVIRVHQGWIGECQRLTVMNARLSGSVDILSSRLCPPGRARTPGGPELGLPGLGNTQIFVQTGDRFVQDRQAEVGDHFGHPEGFPVQRLKIIF